MLKSFTEPLKKSYKSYFQLLTYKTNAVQNTPVYIIVITTINIITTLN